MKLPFIRIDLQWDPTFLGPTSLHILKEEEIWFPMMYKLIFGSITRDAKGMKILQIPVSPKKYQRCWENVPLWFTATLDYHLDI